MTTGPAPYDAFPNAPGLSDELGLTRLPDGGLPPLYDAEGRMWHSICSAHRGGKEGCPRCAVGAYAFVNRKAPSMRRFGAGKPPRQEAAG